MKTNLRKSPSEGSFRKDEQSEISLRIREARGGETASSFARRCGIFAQSLSKYETPGGSLPGALLIKQICLASGVSADWLLGLSEVKQRAPLPPVAAASVNAPATPDAARVLAEVARILAPAKAPVPPTPDVADLTRRLDALDGAVSRLASIVAAVLPKQ